MPWAHPELVDLSARIAAHIGPWRHWPDPVPPWGRGEHPDRFGLFNRSADEVWRDDDGAPVAVRCWDSMLFECKASPADYAADADKAWRKPGAIAIGNFRAFVAPIGVIDPTDVIGSPWGLWEVDDAGSFVMTRAPQRIHQTNHGAEKALLAKLIPEQHNGGAHRNGRAKGASMGTLDQAEGILAANDGALSVGRLRKMLNVSMQADRLADQLAQDARFDVDTSTGRSVVALAETADKEAR